MVGMFLALCIAKCFMKSSIPNSKFIQKVRNNWVSEKNHTQEFIYPLTNEPCTAKWKDLIEIYESDLESDKVELHNSSPKQF